jgi:hypothetical protein
MTKNVDGDHAVFTGTTPPLWITRQGKTGRIRAHPGASTAIDQGGSTTRPDFARPAPGTDATPGSHSAPRFCNLRTKPEQIRPGFPGYDGCCER